MNCPYCNTEVPANREICPNNDCYRPLKPIPIPPNGKVQFGGYDFTIHSTKLTEKGLSKL